MAIAIEQLQIDRSLGLCVDLAVRCVKGALPARMGLAFIVEARGNDEHFDVRARKPDLCCKAANYALYILAMLFQGLLVASNPTTFLFFGVSAPLIDDDPACFCTILGFLYCEPIGSGQSLSLVGRGSSVSRKRKAGTGSQASQSSIVTGGTLKFVIQHAIGLKTA